MEPQGPFGCPETCPRGVMQCSAADLKPLGGHHCLAHSMRLRANSEGTFSLPPPPQPPALNASAFCPVLRGAEPRLGERPGAYVTKGWVPSLLQGQGPCIPTRSQPSVPVPSAAPMGRGEREGKDKSALNFRKSTIHFLISSLPPSLPPPLPTPPHTRTPSETRRSDQARELVLFRAAQ